MLDDLTHMGGLYICLQHSVDTHAELQESAFSTETSVCLPVSEASLALMWWVGGEKKHLLVLVLVSLKSKEHKMF